MNNKDSLTRQQSDDILHLLDDAIQKGPWEESNFLKAVGKNIKDIRNDFETHVKTAFDDSKNEQFASNQAALRSGMQEVFISLYSIDGSLPSWERIVMNLPRQSISRPIYLSEEDVQLLIKTKEKKVNEAYVAIYINNSDIITMDSTKTIVDKLGKTLLTLKDKALRLDNIDYFVHETIVYQFLNGQLIKKS